MAWASRSSGGAGDSYGTGTKATGGGSAPSSGGGGTGWKVDPDQLRTHAAGLRELLTRFDAIRAASASTGLDTEAFGQLCQFLPPILDGHRDEQDQVTEEFATNIEMLADAVEACADDYAAADEDSSGELGALASEL
ncbi:type VII secretion target [Glycomyces luteolus]|uniref:Type VII secretion target n=1 Tax=Glycomyces luteolus TaxID=2670330 RepID=A0A9X3PFQ4_9ACTN|nr:type VII secretion target [Glycomyces luteolus]MDA1363106.1 type VII secretion target [Glycomyces luteolus]